MTDLEKMELAIYRAKERMFKEYPQSPDVLKLLDYLLQEIHGIGR